jgi:hypothetical protein
MSQPQSKAELSEGAMAALRRGNKIEAIKLVRVEHGVGLKEAKDIVDEFVRAHPLQDDGSPIVRVQSSRNGLWWLLIFAVGAIVLYAYLSYK